MAGKGTLTVRVVGDASQFQKTMSNVGRDLTRVGAGLTAALTAPLVGVGVAAFRAADDFQKATNTIRVGTGATGDALAQLEGSFRNVNRTVPNAMGDVAAAIADVSTRTGLSGVALEGLTTQFLNLSRVTGQDVRPLIADVTRVFGDWGVAAKDQSGAMDVLFRATQQTGIGVDQLSQQIVRFGAPLRQMGFSFEDSTALISKFEKEGVNAELVLGSMRIALTRMARAGEEPIETFRRVTDEIKNTGSASEANALALELFGARAGPDMAAAIREGRFEIGDLVDAIANGTDTINTAAGDTLTFSERFGLLKKRVSEALEPLGKSLMQAMERLIPLFERGVQFVSGLAERFANLSPTVQTVVLAVAGLLAALGPVLLTIGLLIPAFGAIGAVLGALVSPVALVVVAVAGLVAAFVYAYKNSEKFRDIVNKAFDEVRKFAEKVWPKVQAIIKSAIDAIRAIIETFVKVAQAIWERFGDLILRFVTTTWNNIQRVIEGVLDIIQGVFEVFAGIFTGDWERVWEGVKQILSGVWDAIAGIVSQALNVVSTVVQAGLRIVSDIWSAAWDAVVSFLSSAWEAIKNAISSGIESALTFFRELPGRILSALGDVGSLLYNAGRDLLLGLARGIGDAIGAVVNKAKEAASKIVSGVKSVFGIRSPSKVFMEIGSNLAAGLDAGWTRDLSELRLPSVSLPSGAVRGGDGGGTPIVVQLHVDGEKMAEVVSRHQGWERYRRMERAR